MNQTSIFQKKDDFPDNNILKVLKRKERKNEEEEDKSKVVLKVIWVLFHDCCVAYFIRQAKL